MIKSLIWLPEVLTSEYCLGKLMLTQNSFSAWGPYRHLWPAGISSQLHKWMNTEKGERTLSWVTWRIAEQARSTPWVLKPGSLLASNYQLLKKIHTWGFIWFHTEFFIEEEKENLFYSRVHSVVTYQIISVSADASSLTVTKSYLDLTPALSASRSWGLWTFQQANSSYVKSCSRNIYTCLPRPQMLLARQAGLPAETSMRKWFLSQLCCNAKLTAWF